MDRFVRLSGLGLHLSMTILMHSDLGNMMSNSIRSHG